MITQQQVPALIGFRKYFEQLEARLGALLVPIQRGAPGPRQIVTAEALHMDLVREAAIEIYRENQCKGMNSPVHLFPTLDALGRLRFKVEEASNTDRASLEFLESLGEATLSILSSEPAIDHESDPNCSL